MKPRPDEPPVGLVGRVPTGPEKGFYVEIDGPRNGGYYILWWTSTESYDNLFLDWLDVVETFNQCEVKWLSAEESARIPGRHRHGR